MRILFLCHSFNSLSQRLFVELRQRGHDVSVEFDINDAVAIEAVRLFSPDLIVAPFLKRAIPQAIWREHVCLVVHPGPPGDRGPAALDWAILNGEREWGVTVLQAAEEMDAGLIWAWRRFAMRDARKSSLYRNEVTEAACAAVLEAIEKFSDRNFEPVPLESIPGAKDVWRGPARQADRAIDWERDDTRTVLRKINSAAGMPGLRTRLFGEEVFIFNATAAKRLPAGVPGKVVARCGGALAVATSDGAVWIGHAKRIGDKQVKLPARHVFVEKAVGLPEHAGPDSIRYEERGGVGFLHFPFYNGAMGTEACKRLLAAYETAVAGPARVLVLMGGPDHWSNGLDLNLIEAASSPAEESWRNINAIDDLAEAIVRTTDKYVIAAVGGNAGAGGVFLARAADEVWMRRGAVLNPHYKDMGNLYGSELWTYLLPRHAGEDNARRITQARLPMGAEEALSLGLANEAIGCGHDAFAGEVEARATALAARDDLAGLILAKANRRARDEAGKPLAEYRVEELSRMRRNFFGFDPSYHVARYNFVHKVAKSRTPVTIARHRETLGQGPARRAAS
ncbi:MAG: hydrogenase maturation protein [Tepidamorphaceae bacterium]